MFGKELFVAVYWAPARLWMLIAASDFELQSDAYVLRVPESMTRNQMHILGDCMIGTTPSLTFRLLSDPTKPRAVEATGHVEFTIADAEIYCGDKLVEDDAEKEIAWFLMNYGDWPAREPLAEIRDGQLLSFDIRVEPRERSNPGQDFEVVGYLSEMVSRQFNEVTAPDGRVRLLSPKREPDAFGVVIPLDYKGKALPLWRFTIRPGASEN